MGPFDNETGYYRDEPWVRDGLWLEQDPDSDLFDDNGTYLYVITDQRHGSSDNEGPDHVKYVRGPYAGRHVEDVFFEICRENDQTVDPNEWESEEYWAALGFCCIPAVLKRWSPLDGYYHLIGEASCHH
jgi:hypothetical protein